MIAVGCEKIEKSYGIDVILKDVTFALNEGEKMGIIGVNGAGKSTLINIICGNIKDYGGNIFISKGLKLGVLMQHTEFSSNLNVYDEALSAFEEVIELERKCDELQQKMSSGDPSLIDEYNKCYTKYKDLGGLEFRARTKSTLLGLGITEEMLTQNTDTLSGGQKTVLALAKLLLKKHDILILDEPTNHLDFKALSWLEKYITSYRKTVIIISHDRYFLDNTVNKILEIQNGKGKVYNGNYSDFVKQKEKNRDVEQKHYDNQQKEIARLRAYIEQQRRWNRERNIIAAESREKAINRMELIDAPEKDPEKIRLKFNEAPDCANDVLELFSLSKGYGSKLLFSDVSFLIKRKERAFILGDNGTGKSTLLKILTGHEKEYAGEYIFGNRVELAYYDQEYQGLDNDNTVLEELYYSVDSDISTTKIRTILGAFLFNGDDAFKYVRDLSGGEKARLTFAKIILRPSNLLILDEPTNHLDINTREVLENALLEYGGTVLAVSHDRYFINKLANRILYLGNNKVYDYKMDYAHFLETHISSETGDTENIKDTVISSGKDNYLKEKKKRSDNLKKQTRIKKLESLIEENEARISDIDNQFSLPEISSDYVKLSELSKEQEEIQKILDEMYTELDLLMTEEEV